jgi:hypothetical protein
MARRISVAALGLAATLVVAATASAAPISGSISGPITSVSKNAFAVKTTLSPTGSSKVSVTAKTTIREQVSGTIADLSKGECVIAMGTKKGSTVIASRISLTPAVKGKCTTGFQRPGGGTRPPGGGTPPPGSGTRPPSGFTPPANFGFATGLISLMKGSKITIKSTTSSTTVVVGSKTQISTTKTLKASEISEKLCAFVFGTSNDKGKTVAAQDVQLSKPRNGSCTFGARRP